MSVCLNVNVFCILCSCILHIERLNFICLYLNKWLLQIVSIFFSIRCVSNMHTGNVWQFQFYRYYISKSEKLSSGFDRFKVIWSIKKYRINSIEMVIISNQMHREKKKNHKLFLNSIGFRNNFLNIWILKYIFRQHHFGRSQTFFKQHDNLNWMMMIVVITFIRIFSMNTEWLV